MATRKRNRISVEYAKTLSNSRNEIGVRDTAIKFGIAESSLYTYLWMYGHTNQVRLSHEDFVKRLKEVNPTIKPVTKYLSCKEKLLVEDEMGIIYSCTGESLLDGKKPQITSAVNINEAYARRARLRHGDKYDYSASEYRGHRENVDIICPAHGRFSINAGNHLQGRGCPGCKKEELRAVHNARYMQKFLAASKKKHGGKYDYSDVVYTGAHDKVTITCPIHGRFIQEANEHIRGSGCPHCSSSAGETAVALALDQRGVVFEREKRFDIGEYSRYRYDFYLPDHQILIEYNGEQHYRPVDWYGGIGRYLQQTYIDRKKCRIAGLLGMMLIEIPFWSYDKINEIIDSYVESRD